MLTDQSGSGLGSLTLVETLYQIQVTKYPNQPSRILTSIAAVPTLTETYCYPIYKARNVLAALDYQLHKDRPKLVSKRGEFRLRRVWSKRSARWAAYEEKDPKQYSYLPSLHERILGHYTASDEPLKTEMAMSPGDPRRIKRTLADVSPPLTKQLFSEKKSRFEPAKL